MTNTNSIKTDENAVNTENSSNIDINVMIVIDTDYVKQNYPNPSTDYTKPTGIDHNSQYMICCGSRGSVNGQGSADLNFSAYPGDHIKFRGTSIYGNSDDAVIICGINYWNGDQVFNNFVTDSVQRSQAVEPNPNSPNGLPALNVSLDFQSYDSQVKNSGSENFYVEFALYTLTDGNTQTLLGYYYWDPSITVQ